MQIFVDGSVVTWSKDGQVISADNFKVLKDSRITVNHVPRDGVTITITDLKVSDSGQYACALNLKQNVLKVVHTLQIEGKHFSVFFGLFISNLFMCAIPHKAILLDAEGSLYINILFVRSLLSIITLNRAQCEESKHVFMCKSHEWESYHC